MSERDYANNYEDWLRDTGGDPGYGNTIPTDDYSGMPVLAPPTQTTAPTTQPTTTTGGTKTRDQIEREGRDYDTRNGLYGGYYDEVAGVWVNGSPRNGRGDTVSNPTLASGSQLRSLSDLWPSWEPPTFGAPAPFDYEDFSAPSLADAEREPGYEFAATQGRKHVEATKAAQGIYKSGQTLKDIYSWASEFAKQNYGGVFDRKLRMYDTNRNNAAQNYMTNYGVSRDVFDRGYNSYAGGYDSKRRFAELEFARDWDEAEAQRDTFKTIYSAGAD